MTYKTLLVEQKEKTLTVTLNRPDKRNALNAQMVCELTEVFDINQYGDDITGVVITGSGSAFCAGADLQYLKSLRANSIEEHKKDSRNLLKMYKRIYDFTKPVIALVNGPAIGGGCGLASICDFIIAAESARFGYPEVKIGFTPAIVSVFLVYGIGYRRAKELLLSGKILSAEQAKEYDLVNKVVADKDLYKFGRNFIAEIQKNSPSSVSLTKKFINHICSTQNLGNILNESAEFNAQSRLEPDFIEGISAFLEKRLPIWKKY